MIIIIAQWFLALVCLSLAWWGVDQWIKSRRKPRARTSYIVLRIDRRAFDWPKHLPIPRIGEYIQLHAGSIDGVDQFIGGVVTNVITAVYSNDMDEISIVVS